MPVNWGGGPIQRGPEIDQKFTTRMNPLQEDIRQVVNAHFKNVRSLEWSWGSKGPVNFLITDQKGWEQGIDRDSQFVKDFRKLDWVTLRSEDITEWLA